MRRAFVILFAVVSIMLVGELASGSTVHENIKCDAGGADDGRQPSNKIAPVLPGQLRLISGSLSIGCRTAIRFGRFIRNQHEAIEALSTFAIACFTWTLWISTRALQKTAVQQGKDTERLFTLEKRPWIQTTFEVVGSPTFGDDFIEIEVILHAKNIGLSPAGEVNSGWFYPHLGADGLKQKLDKYRADAVGRMDYMGQTLFPGEEAKLKGSIRIPGEMERAGVNPIMESLIIPAICVYRSLATHEVFETTRVFTIYLWQIGCPLYIAREFYARDEINELFDDSQGKVIVAAAGIFDITT